MFIRFLFLVLILSACKSSFSQKYVQKYGRGCLYDSSRYEQIPLTAPLFRGNEGLPTSASLREFCPTPGNQGDYGTCTAWASAYAARTILMAQRFQMTPEEISKQAFSPSYVYNQIRLTSDCMYGIYIADALDLLKNEGCVTYNEFGYECEKSVTDKDKQKAKDNMIQDYKRLFVRNSSTAESSIITPVKKALSEGKPVVISLQCFASFDDAKDLWTPSPNDQSNGYHAMAVIAYDDKMYGGAFQLMNSWGVGWGKGGFTWVKYADFKKYCMEAYEVVDFKYNPHSPKLSHSGEVVFKKSDGENMPAFLEKNIFKMNQNYFSGTSFQFLMSHNEPVYLYAIGTDLSKKCSLLFPYNQGISPLLSYNKGTIIFPADQYYVQLDNTKGIDYVCILYANESLNIEEIMQKMEKLEGDIYSRLSEAVGKKRIIPAIDYSKEGKIGFRATRNINESGKIVPLIVEIRHE